MNSGRNRKKQYKTEMWKKKKQSEVGLFSILRLKQRCLGIKLEKNIPLPEKWKVSLKILLIFDENSPALNVQNFIYVKSLVAKSD